MMAGGGNPTGNPSPHHAGAFVPSYPTTGSPGRTVALHADSGGVCTHSRTATTKPPAAIASVAPTVASPPT